MPEAARQLHTCISGQASVYLSVQLSGECYLAALVCVCYVMFAFHARASVRGRQTEAE